ncbi:MAG: KAP family NTPase [Deinococcus sp.]|nr:KAP family NTPase [Deinococcus sp.]
MKLIIPPVTVNPENPFQHDALNREEFGAALLNLVSNVDDNLVISLDAPWGEGKTTFVRMWQGLLTKSGIKSIYFDAFADDFIDDPFIAVTSEIARFAETEFNTNGLTFTQFQYQPQP